MAPLQELYPHHFGVSLAPELSAYESASQLSADIMACLEQERETSMSQASEPTLTFEIPVTAKRALQRLTLTGDLLETLTVCSKGLGRSGKTEEYISLFRRIDLTDIKQKEFFFSDMLQAKNVAAEYRALYTANAHNEELPTCVYVPLEANSTWINWHQSNVQTQLTAILLQLSF